MTRAIPTLGITVVFLALGPGIAQAASFDCAQARTLVEQAICTDPMLSVLDTELGDVYEADLGQADPAQKDALIDQERRWLRYTRDRCPTQVCLGQVYQSRLRQLQAFHGAYRWTGVRRYSSGAGILHRPYTVEIIVRHGSIVEVKMLPSPVGVNAGGELNIGPAIPRPSISHK